jgi:small-conductance mechanosensitive channel
MTETQLEQNTEQPITSKAPFFGRWAIMAMAVLLGVMVIGAVLAWKTNDVMGNLPFLRQPGKLGTLSSEQKMLVDQTPWKTAAGLAALAVTQEELEYARQAERLADHEVDQAFATALRQANLQQRTLAGEALVLQAKVKNLESLVTSDQAALDGVVKGSDDEQLAQAQLGLDQDQLNDAKADLARASGDQRDRIQQELTAREAQMKAFDATNGEGGVGEVAAISLQRYRTLAGLLGGWRKQQQRYAELMVAKAAAEGDAAALTEAHNKLMASSGAHGNGAGAAVEDRLASLKRMSLERQLMSLYDDRVETELQLSDVYGKWGAQVLLQHKIVAHLILLQGMMIGIILMVAIVLGAVAKRLAEKESLDRRRMRTLGWIARLLVQVAALVSVLLVIFGPPDHVSTVLGLVTAGLTVALQDFILAFVGWFILIGRNGIAVGDAVEINAVAGEVIDIGLFRTTLLETGNWTAKGHPTGRRVAFNNKFAISGQFFNFSTAGQWMWDELTVSVPADEDIEATVARVEKTVRTATEKDARQAETEWKHVSLRHGLSQFSAEPAVNLRPTAAGVDLVVRYVTRAAGRFDRRNTLYQFLLESLHSAKAVAPELVGGTQH